MLPLRASAPFPSPLPCAGSLFPSPGIQRYHQHHQGEPHKGLSASHRIQGAVNNVADVWRWQGPARAALVHGTPNVTYYLHAAPPPGRVQAQGAGAGGTSGLRKWRKYSNAIAIDDFWRLRTGEGASIDD